MTVYGNKSFVLSLAINGITFAFDGITFVRQVSLIPCCKYHYRNKVLKRFSLNNIFYLYRSVNCFLSLNLYSNSDRLRGLYMKNNQYFSIFLLTAILSSLISCGGSPDQSGQNANFSSENTNSSVSISAQNSAEVSSSIANSSRSISSNNSVGLPISSMISNSSTSLVSASKSSSASVSNSVEASSTSNQSSSSQLSSNSSSMNSSSTSSILSASSSQPSSFSAGCGKTFNTGDIKGLSVKDGEGRDRSFNINVSPDYSNNAGAAVIFNFHGNGGTSEGSAETGFQYAVAEMHDHAISVFPQGIWWENFGVGWEESCGGYDMIFFDNMLNYLNDNYCINSDKIFVSGMSWGGDMTNALACCRGDKIKSIAPASGPELINSSCPTSKWPITWMRYGTSDGAYSQNLFESTRQFYIQKLGCSTNSIALTDDSQCVAYSGCATPLTVCARPIQHVPLSYPEVQQLWQYWRSLPE